MAQDAELKLKVSLDLAYFRQRLAELGQATAGYSLPINIKFDRSTITKELRNLERALGKKKINIELNLLGGLTKDQLERIQGRLEALSKTKKVEIPVSIKNGATGKDADKVVASIKERLAQNQQIKQGGGKLRIETSVKPSITNEDIAVFKKAVKDRLSKISALEVATKLDVPKVEDLLKGLQKNINRQKPLLAKTSIKPSILSADVKAFKKAVESKLSGITVKVKAELEGISKQPFSAGPTGLAGLQEYMRSQGMGPTGGAEVKRRAMFEDVVAGATFKELQRMTQQANIAGRSGLKTKAQMQEALLQINDAAMEGILGNLQMRMKDPLPMKRGFLDQIARAVFWMAGVDPEYLRQQAAQRRALPGVNFPATVPSRPVSIGPSSTGRILSAGAGPAGMIGAAQAPVGLLPSMSGRSQTQAIVEALIAQQGSRMLPSGGGALVDTKRIYAALQKNIEDFLRRTFTVIEVDVTQTTMGIKDAMGAFAYLAQALQDAESRAVKAKIGDAVSSLITKVVGALRSAEAQAIIPVKVVDYTGQRSVLPPTSPITGSPRLALPSAGKTTQPGQTRFNAVSGGYNRPAPLEARPFYMAPAFASTTRRIPGSAGRMARGTAKPKMVGQEIPLGPSGGGPEEAAFVKAAQNALKFGLATDIAKKSVDNFRASQLPLVGGLREVAGEFGFALQQVLLFGTAYKALAFVQSLPGQILNAAKSQQQYNNALQTATQDTGTFAKELLYVDNVQRAFGLNLETTRTGFTRLYASMAPTGFDSGSIEKLFTGISAATAALQLTPDRAERVIYAFGQMASKGQIMSEELKGQLGDVLPGALAIFAKAAGMSVKEFSKAMEDGEFVGSKFRDTFAKVADELMKRFGTGAQAAGKSLQGLLNTVQGDFQRTLESFAPLANAAAQAILGPLGGSLKQLSMSAQIATGEIERTFMQLKQAQQDLGDLRTGGADPGDIRAAEQNVAALTARYKVLQKAAQDPAIAKQAQDIQSFTQELAKAGTFVMNMAKAIGGVLSPVLNILGTNLTTVISLVTSFYIGFQTARLAAMALMGVLLLYRGLSALLGFGVATQQATALAGAFNILGVSASRAQIQVVGLRLALTALVATTVIGAVVAGIVAIAGAFATMSDRAKEAAQSSRDAAKAAVDAAASGNVAGAQMSMQNILAQSRADKKALETLRSLRSRSTALQREGGFSVSLTPEESAALQGSELTKGMLGGIRGGRRQMQLPTAQQMQRLQQDFGRVAQEQKVSLQEAKSAVTTAQQVAKNIGLNVPTPSAISPEAEEPDEKAKRAAEKAAEDARKLADDKRKYESDLMKMNNIQAIELDNLQFEHWKTLQQEKYNILIAGENSWLSQAIKFQQQLQAVEIDRIEAVRKAREATAKAEINAGVKSYVAGGGGIGGVTGLLQGSTGISSGPHFDVRRADGGRITEAEARALFDAGVNRGLQMTSGYGPRNTGIPGASKFHLGIDLAGAPNTPLNLAPGYSMVSSGMEQGLGYTANVRGPQGQMYKVGHLQEPRTGGMPVSRQRAELKKDYNAALAAQEALNQKEQEGILIKRANIEAQMKIVALIKEQVASITPVEEQKLENQLVQQRIGLLSSGIFGERLETESKIAEATEKATLNIGLAKKEIERNNALASEGKLTNSELTAENQKQLDYIKQQENALANYIPLLRERLGLEQQSAEATLRGQVQRATPLGGMGLSAGFIGPAGDRFEEAIGRGATQDEASRFAELQNQLTLLESRNEAIKQSIYGIGNAFGEALTTGVASLVSGTATAKEVFASFLQSVGQALSQAASQMIATYIAIGIAKMFAGLGGGGGNPAGSGGGISDILPGASKYMEGGGAALGASAGTFGAVTTGYANGGVVPGGFRAFANGGVVSGPTLGLVGEGKYNEAVVPLPDGRSIPVQLGGRSARDLMGNGAPGMPQAPSLSMKFETTKINGVEYVSREQLEQAMAETRRASIAGGAQRGMSMTLDKIKQSPSTRSSIGIR